MRYEMAPCSRCGGTGVLPWFDYVNRGICYRCEGRNSMAFERIPIRTSEEEASLERARKNRAASKARKGPALVAFARGVLTSLEEVVKAEAAALEAERAKRSTYFGEPKKRYELELTLARQTNWEGTYGTTWFYRFEDGEGRALTWFGSKPLGAERIPNGTPVRVKATVKRHDTHKGEKVTVLNRVNLLWSENGVMAA